MLSQIAARLLATAATLQQHLPLFCVVWHADVVSANTEVHMIYSMAHCARVTSQKSSAQLCCRHYSSN